MSLYNAIRPSTIDEVVGDYQWALDRLLSPNSNHAILFEGPSGTGKTALARIFAKAVGAEQYDIEELNFSTNGGVDEVRRIEEDLKYSFTSKVFIIDEYGRTSVDAQKAMRKMLEDIPNGVYFFLCASDTSKIITDIMTRVARVRTAPLDEDGLLAILKKGCDALDFHPKNPVLMAIADQAAGSGRTALNILEDISKATPDQYSRIIDGYGANPEETSGFELAKALFGGKDWKEISVILTSLKEQKADGEGVRRTLLGYVASMCIKQPQHYKAVRLLSNNVYDSGLNGVIGMVGAIYKGDF